MAGEVLKDVPESPSMTQRPGTEGIWSMTGRPSGLIMIMPAQPPLMVECWKTGKRVANFSRHSAT